VPTPEIAADCDVAPLPASTSHETHQPILFDANIDSVDGSSTEMSSLENRILNTSSTSDPRARSRTNNSMSSLPEIAKESDCRTPTAPLKDNAEQILRPDDEGGLEPLPSNGVPERDTPNSATPHAKLKVGGSGRHRMELSQRSNQPSRTSSDVQQSGGAVLGNPEPSVVMPDHQSSTDAETGLLVTMNEQENISKNIEGIVMSGDLHEELLNESIDDNPPVHFYE
jgi:hypothetical protein